MCKKSVITFTDFDGASQRESAFYDTNFYLDFVAGSDHEAIPKRWQITHDLLAGKKPLRKISCVNAGRHKAVPLVASSKLKNRPITKGKKSTYPPLTGD